MEAWLEFARGPLFRIAFFLMALGLLRHLVLTLYNVWRGMRRAGDKNLPWKTIFINTMKWLFPFKNLNNRLWYSITSVLFHVGLILTPIFLMAHIALWERVLGFGWPGLGRSAADALTLLTVVTGIMLIIGRAASRESRALSRFQDYALPPLLLVPFVSGFLAMHPSINPFSYTGSMLVHALSGDLILILIPFTKLAHMVLLPTTQLVSEVGWHFPPDQGVNVGIALHKENEPV